MTTFLNLVCLLLNGTFLCHRWRTLFFMTALSPPTEIQSRAPKVNQVGLPMCCSWNSAQFMGNCPLFSYSIFQENIVHVPQKPIKFQSGPSVKQILSPGELWLHLGQHHEETHYQRVNMNSSRKRAFAFLPCTSLKPGRGAHASRQKSGLLSLWLPPSSLTLQETRELPGWNQRIFWPPPNPVRDSGLYRMSLRNVIHLRNAPGKQQYYIHQGKSLPGD